MMTTLKPETEGVSRIFVLCPFCRALDGFSTVTLTSDKSLSTLVIGRNSILLHFIMSMFYMLFTTGFAITDVVEKSDGDNVFLQCTSDGVMMG